MSYNDVPNDYTPLPERLDAGIAACASTMITSIFTTQPGGRIDASPAPGLHFYIQVERSTNKLFDDMPEWYSYTVNGRDVGNRHGCVRVVMEMLFNYQRLSVVETMPIVKDFHQIKALVMKRIDALWPVTSSNGDRSQYYTQYLERVGEVVYEHDTSRLRNDQSMHLASIHHMVMLLDELTHLAHVRAKYPQYSFETISELASRQDGR